MALRCKLWERECNGCQNCTDTDAYIDAFCYDLGGEFLDFNRKQLVYYKEAAHE